MITSAFGVKTETMIRVLPVMLYLQLVLHHRRVGECFAIAAYARIIRRIVSRARCTWHQAHIRTFVVTRVRTFVTYFRPFAALRLLRMQLFDAVLSYARTWMASFFVDGWGR